jgi:ribosomal-protein-alanine N-acetyltransferase
MDILTERLSLRPTKPSDLPALFAFLGDAQAMRHTHHCPTLRDCRRHVAGHEWQRRRLGYAPWTIRGRADGEIIGWGGIFEDPFEPGWGVELGYWLAPSAWGRGYAGELAAACIAHARDGLGLSELQAFARPGNTASCRVLERAGFELRRYVPELERHLYRHALGR